MLSSIIVVSLKGMFMQFDDLKQVWRTSRADAVIWFVTFAAVVGLDIDIGLAVGVGVSVVVLLLRNQKPETALLGNVGGTDIYLDISKYRAVRNQRAGRRQKVAAHLVIAECYVTYYKV